MKNTLIVVAGVAALALSAAGLHAGPYTITILSSDDKIQVHQAAAWTQAEARAHLTDHTLADRRIHAARLDKLDTAPFRFGDDRQRQRMLARPFDTRRRLQQVRLLVSGRRVDRHYTGPALRQRTGLVDDQGIDSFKTRERLGILDQDA